MKEKVILKLKNKLKDSQQRILSLESEIGKKCELTK